MYQLIEDIGFIEKTNCIFHFPFDSFAYIT